MEEQLYIPDNELKSYSDNINISQIITFETDNSHYNSLLFPTTILNDNINNNLYDNYLDDLNNNSYDQYINYLNENNYSYEPCNNLNDSITNNEEDIPNLEELIELVINQTSC